MDKCGLIKEKRLTNRIAKRFVSLGVCDIVTKKIFSKSNAKAECQPALFFTVLREAQNRGRSDREVKNNASNEHSSSHKAAQTSDIAVSKKIFNKSQKTHYIYNLPSGKWSSSL